MVEETSARVLSLFAGELGLVPRTYYDFLLSTTLGAKIRSIYYIFGMIYEYLIIGG